MKYIAGFVIFAAIAQGQQTVRPRIVGVDHVGIYSADIEKSRGFYHDFLGFEEFGASSRGGAAFFKINDRQYIEVMPENRAGTDRLDHISIETGNAVGLRRYLAGRGVPVPAGVSRDAIGNLGFTVRDPDGHAVEVMQYGPESLMVRDRGKHLPADRASTHMMHAGIIVTKFDEAMSFYRDLLGFREIWRGSSNETELSWVNLQVPDGEDYIELMLYREAPAPARRGTAHHVALEVPDMDAAVKALEARPYRARYTRPIESKTGRNRKRQANLYDPDGTRVEFMEPKTVDGVAAPSSTAPPPG